MLKRSNNFHVISHKSKKGFTLVELIVVIVVLGILAAIGIPRYNNYVNESRLAHIKADMKTISSLIEVVAMDDDGVFRDGTFDDLSELEKAITEGRAYREGNLLLPEDDIGGGLHVIKAPFIKNSARSKLKGTFLIDKNDEVYYIADRKFKGESKPNESGDNGGNSGGQWKFTNIESGIIEDYLLTATNGVEERYLMINTSSLVDTSNPYETKWDELMICSAIDIEKHKMDGFTLLKNGKIYDESMMEISALSNFRIKGFYVTEYNHVVFEDTEDNLHFSPLGLTLDYVISMTLSKDDYEQHLNGNILLSKEGDLYEVLFNRDDGFSANVIDSNVSKIVGGVAKYGEVLYEKEGEIYLFMEDELIKVSDNVETNFAETKFSDFIIDENTNVYLWSGEVIKWLESTKDVFMIDEDKYITITDTKVYESMYHEEMDSPVHKEIMEMEHGDILEVSNSENLGILHKNKTKIMRTIISPDKPMESKDITEEFFFGSNFINESDLMNKKPTLYTEGIYSINDILYVAGNNQVIQKHEGYRYIALGYRGVYLRDNKGVIHFLDLISKSIYRVETTDEATRDLISNMGELQKDIGGYILIDGKVYEVDSNQSSYLKITEMEKTKDITVTELHQNHIMRLKDGKYVEIHGDSLDERGPESVISIEGQYLSELIEGNEELYPKIYPSEINPKTTKYYQGGMSDLLFMIIDNGRIWINSHYNQTGS